ncbi:MAG TPA: molybdenum cofactor biosynthesis protein MoaE [Acidimicrobiales bacterium]|nr:molybdenum cofactor biosynthesis protein MoaE [Acidimicrobiales bacterium]
MTTVRFPEADDWSELTEETLPVGAIADWAVRPNCGAVTVFVGTVRDHAEGRDGVTSLDYEAYSEHVVPRFEALIAEARGRWDLGRVAVVHRVGRLAVTEASVVVAVSSPHRAESFEAARFCIEALKATAPIWKREEWDAGTDWAAGARPVTDLPELSGA